MIDIGLLLCSSGGVTNKTAMNNEASNANQNANANSLPECYMTGTRFSHLGDPWVPMVVVAETKTTVTVAKTANATETFTFNKEKVYGKQEYRNPREMPSYESCGVRNQLRERGEYNTWSSNNRYLTFDVVRANAANLANAEKVALQKRRNAVREALENALKTIDHADEAALARAEAAVAALKA